MRLEDKKGNQKTAINIGQVITRIVQKIEVNHRTTKGQQQKGIELKADWHKKIA